MYDIRIYFQGSQKNERVFDAKWSAKNWRQAAAICLKKVPPFVRANINKIVVRNPHDIHSRDEGERVYRSENPYDFEAVRIKDGKRLSKRITEKTIIEKRIAAEIRQRLLNTLQQNQKEFYNKFQNFVTAKPDTDFTMMLDIGMKYAELMKEFAAGSGG